MIKAKTIMTEKVITIKENATVAEAAKLMINKHVNTLLITKNNEPVSVATISDLIRGIVNKNPNIKVKEVMSKKFLAISLETNYSRLIKKMREEKIKIFPVVENSIIAGIITETDIIEATRDFTRFHRIMQDTILVIFGLATVFFLFLSITMG